MTLNLAKLEYHKQTRLGRDDANGYIAKLELYQVRFSTGVYYLVFQILTVLVNIVSLLWQQ